jgi:type IV secretory pathway component VirB8
VNFEAQMYLTDGTKKGPQELFQVDIVIGYANTKVLEKNGHINPFGLSVNSYSLRKLR